MRAVLRDWRTERKGGVGRGCSKQRLSWWAALSLLARVWGNLRARWRMGGGGMAQGRGCDCGREGNGVVEWMLN